MNRILTIKPNKMKPQKTSLEAYENMKPKIPNDHLVILSVLDDKKPLTYNEIAKDIRVKYQLQSKTIEALKWSNPNKVSRRMKELVEAKKVEVCEPRICTIVKSNCKTYRLNVDQIEMFFEEIRCLNKLHGNSKGS